MEPTLTEVYVGDGYRRHVVDICNTDDAWAGDLAHYFQKDGVHMDQFGLSAEQSSTAGPVSQIKTLDGYQETQQRYSRWSQFDVVRDVSGIGKQCWLDHETGRLVFAEAGANPNK